MAAVGNLHPIAARSRAQARGSLHAPDAEMAIKNARDVYTRRNEGVSIWVVRSADIHASSPGDRDALFEPANDKVYRHPTFFPMPDEVKHI